MGELANCTRCDALFVKSLRDICKKCYEKEETAFRTVSGFLRMKKNREATMNEVIEETGVSGDLIKKFIKEKRLLTSQFPKLGYPCETCGASIKSGKICSDCSEELLRDLDSEKREAERAKRLKAQETKKAVYYSLKNNE